MTEELPELTTISKPEAKETFVRDINTVSGIPEETLTDLLSYIRDEEYSGQIRVRSEELSQELNLDRAEFDSAVYLIKWLSKALLSEDINRDTFERDIEKLDSFLNSEGVNRLETILDFIDRDEYREGFKRAQAAGRIIETGVPHIRAIDHTLNKRVVYVDGEPQGTIPVVEITFRLKDRKDHKETVYIQATPDHLKQMVDILRNARDKIRESSNFKYLGDEA